MGTTLATRISSLAIGVQNKGAVFSVMTGVRSARGSKYLLVVTDPKKHDVAVMTNSNYIRGDAALCRIMGSLSGDSLVAGNVTVGSHMFIRDNGDMDGNTIKTRPVTGIWMMPSRVHGEDIVAKAEINFAETVEETIKKEFQTEKQDWVRGIVGFFGNPAGKSAALQALIRAKKHGKIHKATRLMEQYWHRFWVHEFPEIAGDPGTELNESRWKGFHIDAGIPLPV